MKNRIMLLGSLLTLTLVCQAEVGDVQMTFKAVDESGKPMPGVRLGAAFIQSKVAAPIN